MDHFINDKTVLFWNIVFSDVFIFYCRIVFVNNFAFGPGVDHKLKERFASMREGKHKRSF